MIFLTNPELLESFDETGFEVDQGKDAVKGLHAKEFTGTLSKSGKQQFTVDRKALTTHTSLHVTGIGGSTADGNAIRSGFIMPGKSHNEETHLDVNHRGNVVADHRPTAPHLFAKDGKPLPAAVTANGKGGMDDDMDMWLLFNVILPTFENKPSVEVRQEPSWRNEPDNPFRRSDSADETLCFGDKDQHGPGTMRARPPVVICDGHSSHLTARMLDALHDLSTAELDGVKCTGRIKTIGLVLRVPRSSHWSCAACATLVPLDAGRGRRQLQRHQARVGLGKGKRFWTKLPWREPRKR